MLLSAVSVLVVALSSSEIPEGLMNNPVYRDNTEGSFKVPPSSSGLNLTPHLSQEEKIGVTMFDHGQVL